MQHDMGLAATCPRLSSHGEDRMAVTGAWRPWPARNQGNELQLGGNQYDNTTLHPEADRNLQQL